MKVSKSFSLDIEVVQEMNKRHLGSEWLNSLLRRELNLDEKSIEDIFDAEPVDLIKEREEIAKMRGRDE